MMRVTALAAMLMLVTAAPSIAGENPSAKLAMHVVASDEYLYCPDLIPAACESINVDVSAQEILAASGYGFVAFVAYDVEGITGAEFAVDGWPTGRGAPTLSGPYWCSEDALTLGDPLDGGGIISFPCGEASENGIVLIGYYSFGPLDEEDLPITLEYAASSFSYPDDPHNLVLDCTIQYEEDTVVGSTGCTIGGTHGQVPDCGEGMDGPGGDSGPEGAPEVSFLGPTIQRASHNGCVFALAVSDSLSDVDLHLERDGVVRPVRTRWVFHNVLECRAETNTEDIGFWDVILTRPGDYELSLPRTVRLVESPARTRLEESGLEYLPGIVGAKIRHSALALPEGVAEAWPAALAVCSDALRQVFGDFSISTIRKIFRDKTPADTLAECRPGQVVRVEDLSRYYELTFPDFVNVGDIVAALEALPEVMQVWPRGRKQWETAPLHPNDSLYVHDEQWNLNNTDPGREGTDIEVPDAWGMGTVSGDVVIAVNDMGIQYQHEDLAATGDFPNWKVTCGHNLVDPGQDPNDPYEPGCIATGHGTFIAGIAGAVTDNWKGIAGVAWGSSQLAAIKMGTCQAPLYSAQGIMYAVDSCGADVINLSYSGLGYEPDDGAAAQHANAWGTFIAAAVSNNAHDHVVYPAGCNYAVGVTRTENSGYWSQCNYGPHVDLAAPGVNVVSTWNDPDTPYRLWTGTSFATPHVAGLVALLKDMAEQRVIYLHSEDIVGIMCASADTVRSDQPYTYPNDYVGWGKINAGKAAERLFWPYNGGGGPSRYTAVGYDTCESDSVFVWGDTTYYRMCTKKLVHFPVYQDTPFAWGYSWYATLGSIRDARDENEMEWPWCRVIPSTITCSSCSLKTHLYYRVVPGKPEGEWVTREPEELVWGYAVSGIPGSLGVENSGPASSAIKPPASVNYPNPFNPTTCISFTLLHRQPVNIAVYDVMGRSVRRLLDQAMLDGGSHRVDWDGLDDSGAAVASGVYLYRLETPTSRETGKMILTR